MNIQKIAQLAKVSVSTVSKVMNGKDKDISEETRNRVLKTIKDNNYVPYAKYREKEGVMNRLIGLIIRKNNTHYGEIISKVEETLKEQDYHLLVSTVGESRKEKEEALEQLQKWGVQGVLVDSCEKVKNCRESCRLVYFTADENYDSEIDNIFYFRKSEAGRIAAEHLIKAGHTDISCLLLKEDWDVLNGAEAACREHGLNEDSPMHYIGKNIEDIRQNGLAVCMGDMTSAAICGDAEIVGCVLEYARTSGVEVPKELSVICTREQKVLEYLNGGITAVEYAASGLAGEAATHLLKQMTEKTVDDVCREFPPKFIGRDSVRNRSIRISGKKMIIVGSMNQDNTIQSEHIPVRGATQIVDNILTSPGGKGGNQAVGVGKLGGQAYMIGRLGKDAEGRMLFKNLMDNGVHTEGVEFDEEEASGQAFIHIDQKGENMISVYRGANEKLDKEQLLRHADIFRNARYCLLSSEISNEMIAAVIRTCKEQKTEIILKPSTLDSIDNEVLKNIDYLVPNEIEMKQITGGKHSLEEGSGLLLNCGVKNVIVTLGQKGAYLRNEKQSIYFPSAPFTAVDSTGGADSFISAMAVALSEGKDLIFSIIYATYAAGITITRYGVQEAMPDKNTINIYREDIEKLYIEKRNEGE